MRKYFEGHSPVGVAIIVSAFALALLLRLFDLGGQSPWTDELASWWYGQNLSEVFRRESHSPLYYAFLSLFVGDAPEIYSLRLFSAVISIVHLVECFFLGQDVFKKKNFLIFWIIICLNPADIIYARMARHYAWLMEGVLVFYLLWRRRSPVWLLCLVAAFMGFVHVFSVVPVLCLAMYGFIKDRDKKTLALVSASSLLIVLYYFVRISVLGHEAVRANVSWNSLDTLTFWKSVLTQYLGDSYPRFEFYPVDPVLALVVVSATSLFILWKRKESGYLYFGILLVSFLAIELLSFWINLRTNRYVIYLVAFWIVAFVESIDEVKEWHAPAVFVLFLAFLMTNNPVVSYPWDREKVVLWKDYRKHHPGSDELVCANVYQSTYYQLNAPTLCREAVFGLKFDRPLMFFDLNNNDRLVAFYLSKQMELQDLQKVENGFMAYFVPKGKEKNGKPKR